MKFLFLRVPRCGNHDYTISIYSGDRRPANEKITTLNDNFEEGFSSEYTSIDQNKDIDCDIITSVTEKVREIGENPSDSDSREIYDMLFSNLKTTYDVYTSKYSSEISQIAKKNLSEWVEYFEGEPKEDGTYDASQRRTSSIFQFSGKDVPELYSGMEIYVTKVNDGYGCMTSRAILGLFCDKDECLNFERKVDDVLKAYNSWGDSHGDWKYSMKEKFKLNPDLVTFTQVSR